MKVKKGDTVVVIAGKDKGAKGKVIAAYPRRDKVLVEGVNRMKKHEKIRTTQRGRRCLKLGRIPTVRFHSESRATETASAVSSGI